MRFRKIAPAVLAAAFVCALPFVADAQLRIDMPACEGPDCGFQDFIQLIQNVISFLITLAIPISAILFSYAGYLYLTSMGAAGPRSKALGIFKNVFWGLVIALSAWMIVNLITNFFLKKSVEDVFQGRIETPYEIA